MLTYEKIIRYWNNVFKEDININSITKSTGNEDLDRALDWLCEDSNTMLDFGCGNGLLLFKCFLRGTKNHIGIDISIEGIKVAKKIQEQLQEQLREGNFDFIVGGVEELKKISSDFANGVVLSNIIDNLIPSDAIKALKEIKRILKVNGKVLLKLNPFLTDSQIKEWNIKVIEDNLLDDGLFLWNQTTKEWEKLLSHYFKIVNYKEIYYPEYDQYNRLFLVCNDNK